MTFRICDAGHIGYIWDEEKWGLKNLNCVS